MGQETKIEWCHHSWNPWWGCVKVSDGCKNCYAQSFDKRIGGNHWGPNSERRFFGDKHWAEPLKWNREAEQAGERRRVFCASMADVFEDRVDLMKERTRLFELIQQTPHLDWLLLTKRPENIASLLRECYMTTGESNTIEMLDCWLVGIPPENVWLGTSVESNDVLQRAGILASIPATVRFLSVEPMLGPLHLTACVQRHIHWLIFGGESGAGARPMELEWLRLGIINGHTYGTSVFVKQFGKVLAKHMGLKDPKGGDIDEWPEWARVREFPQPARVTA